LIARPIILSSSATLGGTARALLFSFGMAARDPHQILRAIDSLTACDPAPPRLDGCVVVIVRGPTNTSFWYAAFSPDRLLGSGYLSGLPPDADAILLFEEEQADAVFEGKMPASKVAMYGPNELLRQFVDRYCTFRTIAGVRAGM
jgi:hypothetical protein